MLEALADWPGENGVCRDWHASTKSRIARAAAGVHRLKWAWEAQGREGGAAWHRVKARLPGVRDELVAIARQDRDDPTILPWLLWCMTGLHDEEAVTKVFAECRRRDPTVRAAYSAMTLSRTASWFGSNQECIEWAHEHALSAPRGHGIPAILIEAHWWCSQMTDESHWKQPRVQADVFAANEACNAEGYRGMNGVRTRHYLAFGLWKCGNYSAAKTHFRELGEVCNQWPWGGARFANRWLNPFFKARKQCRKA